MASKQGEAIYKIYAPQRKKKLCGQYIEKCKKAKDYLTPNNDLCYIMDANQFQKKIMAVIIKVLDQHSKKPLSGIRVSYSSNRGSGREKITDQTGCVSYAVDPVHAVVTIKDVRRPEQYLKKGENVFHI